MFSRTLYVAILAVWCAVAVLGHTEGVAEYQPRSVPLSGLDLSGGIISSALSESGLLGVSGVPGLAYLRDRIESLGFQCFQDYKVKGDSRKTQLEVILPDGSIRTTMALNSKEGAQGLLDECQEIDALMNQFQSTVGNVVSKISQSLQGLCDADRFFAYGGISKSSKREFDRDYMSFSDVFDESSFLTHMHHYQKEAFLDSEISADSVQLHTDHGLILGFLPAMYIENSRNDDTSPKDFFVEMSDGTQVPVDLSSRPRDELLLMVGEAGGSILGRYCKFGIHATPHKVSIAENTKRIWLGTMVLPPLDLVYKDTGSVTSTSSHYGSKVLERSQQIPAGQHIGCDINDVLQEVVEGGCAKDEMFCWMQCMKFTKDLNPVTCKAQDSNIFPGIKHKLECISANGKEWHGGMCTDCSLQCVANETSQVGDVFSWRHPLAHDPEFCSGIPSVMYMNGFTFDYSKRPKDACLTFLFDGFVIDNFLKYWLFVAVAFLLGYSVEWIIVLRKTGLELRYRKQMVISLYALQLVIGYLVMLVAMTYSLPFFVSTVLGIVSGHCRWNMEKNSKEVGHTDPCCKFDVEEANGWSPESGGTSDSDQVYVRLDGQS